MRAPYRRVFNGCALAGRLYARALPAQLHGLGLLEGAAGAPAGGSFLEALGDFVAASGDGTDPEADFVRGYEVFDVKRVEVVVFAEADGDLGTEGFARVGVAFFVDAVVALAGRIGRGAAGEIAAVGSQAGDEAHAQMVERAMDRGGLRVRRLRG